MKYILKSRGLGKTSDLIELCLAHNGILIVPNETHKHYIQDCLCPKMNIQPDNLNILTVEDFINYNLSFKEDTPIYIDDFQYLIEKLFNTKNITISGTLTELL